MLNDYQNTGNGAGEAVGKIVLDFSNARTMGDVEKTVSKSFFLPDNALKDREFMKHCLQEFFRNGRECTVELRGFHKMRSELRAQCGFLLGVFRAVRASRSNVLFVIPEQEKERSDDPDSFRALQENPIILDFSNVRNWEELHDMLKDKFGLPDYYGRNWDALMDCLDSLFEWKGRWDVELHGFLTMDKDLAEDSGIMLDIFRAVHEKTPNVKFVIVS
ncbi:MAG: barstar family protein [Clostridia bacterium]|nr:barstar family protein [Clostridia bacterium]